MSCVICAISVGLVGLVGLVGHFSSAFSTVKFFASCVRIFGCGFAVLSSLFLAAEASAQAGFRGDSSRKVFYMKLNANDYRNKVLGCWLGKNVGGTVGAPFEWRRQINDISFYVQENLNGQPLPNDDLDIQLLWLCAMEERGLDVTAQRLADYWCLYVAPHWAEYGTGKINMRQGLLPPLSGSFQNVYKHSCGSYIRSEIWACIAPGLPDVAARYACEDAVLDHGDGEGTFAEIFMASMESAAFVVSDLRKLIEIGLSYIPADCGVAKAVHTTLECFDSGKTWLETRDEILRHHRGSTFGGNIYSTSERDRKLGFHEGVLGYDVPSNIAITLVGLLYGGDDFSAVQCTAVNCGEDTDCTAATSGALWGIIHGADAIPQKWLDPIGRGIRTICLNVGDLGGIPRDVDNLTDRTVRLARQVLIRNNREEMCSSEATDLASLDPDTLKAKDEGRSVWNRMHAPVFKFDFFTVEVNYGAEPVIRDGEPKALKFTIRNSYRVQANLSLHWYLPEGWKVIPAPDGYAMSFPTHIGGPLEMKYEFLAERVTRATNRAVLEITIEGRPTVMLVPVTLLNGNMMPGSVEDIE